MNEQLRGNEDGRDLVIAVSAACESLPTDEILRVAKNVQRALIAGEQQTQSKEGDEIFTSADTAIQAIILDYMDGSPLGGTFRPKVEEAIPEKQRRLYNEPGKTWQLLIDPLDGTKPFTEGRDEWGTTVGACDTEGRLFYSWNLLWDGQVFDSETVAAAPRSSFAEKTAAGQSLAIDVFDYGAGAAEKVGEIVGSDITSYDAAVAAAGGLVLGNLDGLLWLPSNRGKKNYPDYDLICLGAIKASGREVRLGKNDEGEVEMIAIGPNDEDAEYLARLGLEIMGPDKRNAITVENSLRITGALET